MQPGHCAVPVRRSLQCSPDVEFGSIRFTNRVQNHRRCLHRRERRPGSVAFLLVPGGWHGLVRVDCWLLAGGSWGLTVPFPELALEVGHVRLVGELVRVRERSGGDSLRKDRDTLGKVGMRIERAVHVGAHGKQALNVHDEVLG
jgi:hypothetical protein